MREKSMGRFHKDGYRDGQPEGIEKGLKEGTEKKDMMLRMVTDKK